MALARQRSLHASLKSDGSVVTDVDREIQAMICRAVAERFPDHAVVGEETLDCGPLNPPREKARYCWVVDPIDGTRNYAAGLPSFSTSIGVLDEGRPVVGVIYDPNLGDLFAAAAGLGATRNGRPMQVSGVRLEREYLIGFPSEKDRESVAVVRSWAGERGYIARAAGSTALHLAWVACGALDASFGQKTRIWDLAGGAVLVAEAGGKIEDPYGGRLFPFGPERDVNAKTPYVAATPRLFEPLMTSIQEAVREKATNPRGH